jgi:hypothetical protein
MGFQFKIINKEFNLYLVIYRDENYPIDGNVSMNKVFLYNWLTVKAKGWEYEDKFRAVSISGQEIIKYEPEMIRDIFFGCNVPDISTFFDHCSSYLKRLYSKFF